MTPEQNAAIEALKAELTNPAGLHHEGTVHEAIDRAVEISRRERVPSPEEVERVARALYELDPLQGLEHDADHRPFGPHYTVTWEMLADWDAGIHETAFILARAAISAMTPAAEVEQWTPIETAPKDGTQFLATVRVFHARTGDFLRHDMHVVAIDADTGDIDPDYYQGVNYEAWMPLPAPPSGDPKP